MPGPRWYVVRCKAQACFAAQDAVEALGYPVLLPLVSFPLPHGARELRPAFGNYLFACFDVRAHAWGAITRLPPLVDRPVLCGAGGAPAAIPTALIDRMWRMLGRPAELLGTQGGRPVIDDPVAMVVSVGAEVRLMDRSLWDGKAGVVEATRRGGRLARVAIDGLALPMWVPADRLALL
jgi:hypothetical protein